MVISNFRILIVCCFCCFVVSEEVDSEPLQPRTKKTSHYYRDLLFLDNEGQSCDDISDHRKIERTKVKFCSIKAPKPDVSTTLSFWGWDNEKGNTTGSVELYYVNDDTKEEELMFKIEIPKSHKEKDLNYVQWFHYDFIMSSYDDDGHRNISELILYYSAHEGGKEEINLRDVWIRPTKKNDGKRPPRSCNIVLSLGSIWIFYLTLFSYPICLFILCCPKFFKTSPKYVKSYLCSTFFTVIFTIMVYAFTSEYPNVRCKNDDYFIGIIIFGLIGIFITYTNYKRVSENDDNSYDRSIEIVGNNRRLPNNNVTNSEIGMTRYNHSNSSNEEQVMIDVIKIATQNTKNKKFENRKVYITSENECSICMETFTKKRPGVVTECGHVWCSECISDICKMRLPNHSGICPTCRSAVELKNLILFNEEKHSGDRAGGGAGGGGGGETDINPFECSSDSLPCSTQDIEVIVEQYGVMEAEL